MRWLVFSICAGVGDFEAIAVRCWLCELRHESSRDALRRAGAWWLFAGARAADSLHADRRVRVPALLLRSAQLHSSGRVLSLSKNISERGSRATPCNCCSREYHLTSDHLESGTSPRHAQSPVLCRAAGRSCLGSCFTAAQDVHPRVADRSTHLY